MIVIENDQDAWNKHVAIAKDKNNVYKIADIIRDEFEDNVNEYLNKIDPSHSEYIVNIMREMLLGWGATPYENIACEIMNRLEEGK